VSEEDIKRCARAAHETMMARWDDPGPHWENLSADHRARLVSETKKVLNRKPSEVSQMAVEVINAVAASIRRHKGAKP